MVTEMGFSREQALQALEATGTSNYGFQLSTSTGIYLCFAGGDAQNAVGLLLG